MSEYIVRETGYPGRINKEIISALVRCEKCKYSEPMEKMNPAFKDLLLCTHTKCYTEKFGYCHRGVKNGE